MFLPRLTDHSTETIEQALAQQHPDKDFPPLPPGKFENVRNSKESQVMFFRYDTTVGYRSTCSTQHSNITPPLKRHKNKHTLTREPKIRVGFDYIFGYPHSYDITEEGEIILKQGLPPSPLYELTENQWTIKMVKQLEDHYGTSRVKVEGLCYNGNHYCPFSGGGDIQFLSQQQLW